MPRRTGHLYEKLLDRGFIKQTVIRACAHRHGRKDVRRVMLDLDGTVERLRSLLSEEGGYRPSRYSEMQIFDEASQKRRTIRTVPFFPGCLVQWLIVEAMKGPVFMRGMDHWSSASIPGRGGHYIYRGILGYIRHNHRSARYVLQCDVRHYYDTIDIDILMGKLRRRCKDERFLALVERVLRASSADGRKGIGIGYHLNQWIANFFLEDIDRAIRNSGYAGFYVRYMDNMTAIGPNKRKLRKLRMLIEEELGRLSLELKGDWQVFPLSARPISSVGYRYTSEGKVLLRKRNWLKLRRQLMRVRRKQREHKPVATKQARAVLSRFGAARKYAPSGRIFRMAAGIDFSDLRRKAA